MTLSGYSDDTNPLDVCAGIDQVRRNDIGMGSHTHENLKTARTPGLAIGYGFALAGLAPLPSSNNLDLLCLTRSLSCARCL
jgi:hypothetical protein